MVDGVMEVEVLMKRMVELQQQQQEEEECTQEEMVTRFERQRSESIPTGTNMDTVVSCLQKFLSRHFCTRHISFSNWVEASLTNTRLGGNL